MVQPLPEEDPKVPPLLGQLRGRNLGVAASCRPGESVESGAAAQAEQEGDLQDLQQRLWKSDDLIQQLKHIVKAQHNKIEELRERLDFKERGVHVAMASQDETDVALLKEENEEYRREANRLRAEQARLKADNDTLRKVNRRLKAMVVQEPCDESCGGGGHDFTQGDSLSADDTQRIGKARDGSRSTKWGFKDGGGTVELPAFSKASKLLSSMPIFWRDMESTIGVLYALLEVAERLVSDRPSTVLTLYTVDPTVRSQVAAAEPRGKVPQTVFYLGRGRTELQVFSARRCNNRAEPPRFADLQALPYRTRSAMAVAVQMPESHRILAILQAVTSAEEVQSPGRAPTPRVLRRHCNVGEAATTPGFTDSQLAYLQLVCSVTAGCLSYVERLEQRSLMLERMRSSVDIAVAVNKARSLADLEQRIKHLLGPFFGVSIVRVLYFDVESQKLLVPCAQMRKKDYASHSIEKGIVGLCAKKRVVICVSSISKHPYVDPIADGLQRTGRSVSSDACMLCGPLLAEAEGSEGGSLLGVVQLLERRRPAGGGAAGDDFTDEEQAIFQQLLQVFAHAGLRALKAQELAARLEGSPAGLARLLIG